MSWRDRDAQGVSSCDGRTRPRGFASLAVLALAVGLLATTPDAIAQDARRVWQTQRCLTALSFYDGPIDGIFGSATQDSVLGFQQAAGIAPTAALDNLTWATLQAAHHLAGSPFAPTADGSGDVTIAEAQRILARLGYDPGPVDGALGPSTIQALGAFQQARGIPDDAPLDQETMAALRARAAELTAEVADETDQSARFAEVFEVQMLLGQLGFGDLTPDGQFGPSTSRTLAAFQRAEGLADSGDLSPETLERLRQTAPLEEACLALIRSDLDRWLALLGYDEGVSNTTLEAFQREEGLDGAGALTPETYSALQRRAQELGDIPRENSFVVEAQMRLAAADYVVGPIDGIAGQQLETALRAYQQGHSLRVTGRIDQDTLASLRGNDHDDAPVTASMPPREIAFQIAVDAENGALVGTVPAVGAAAEAGMSYALAASADGRFAIDPSTGDISVADADRLDFDRDQSHRLVVEVTDGDGTTRTDIVRVGLAPIPRLPADDTHEQAVLELEPVAYWRLDAEADGVEDSGGGYGDTAVDRMGRHPGTYNGGTDTDDVGPFAGISIGTTHFDGDDEFIRIADAAEFVPNNGSIILWFVADRTAGESALVYFNGGEAALDLSIIDARLRFAIGPTAVETTADTVDAGRWHHVAAVWGDDSLTLLLDGTVVGSQSGPIAAPTGSGALIIGAANDESRTFAGRISEAALLGAPLSNIQIAHLIDRGINGMDILLGTPSSDTLNVAMGSVIYGEAGNDVITGSPDDDTVFAGPGDDSVDGAGGNDRLFGGDGNDVFVLAPTGGTSWVYGGSDGSEDTVRPSDIGQEPNTVDWSYALTDGVAVEEGPDYVLFAPDSDGYVILVDGTRLDFEEIERIEW